MENSYSLIRTKPIASQLASILRKRIIENTYDHNGCIPSEINLAEEFMVSRSTVRDALSVLVAENLIIRKQGSGTFVNKRVLEFTTNFSSLWEYTEPIKASGRVASVKPDSLIERSATESEALALGINPGDRITALSRIYYADEQPVVYSAIILPSALLSRKINRSSANNEIGVIIKRYCKRDIHYVTADLKVATPAEEKIRRKLNLSPGSPILHFFEIFFDKFAMPLGFVNNYHNDRLLRLRLSIKTD